MAQFEVCCSNEACTPAAATTTFLWSHSILLYLFLLRLLAPTPINPAHPPTTQPSAHLQQLEIAVCLSFLYVVNPEGHATHARCLRRPGPYMSSGQGAAFGSPFASRL